MIHYFCFYECDREAGDVIVSFSMGVIAFFSIAFSVVLCIVLFFLIVCVSLVPLLFFLIAGGFVASFLVCFRFCFRSL